ncbi:DUF5658 family protein [Halomonas sp. B23F22_10]|uniref:DUF5658 family protein n=1 Tax=Halomonas sp. B23F22_10 TaxID=3459515 RepID=UPI00373F5FBB
MPITLATIAAILLLIASLADTITTIGALKRGGIEANPVVAWMIEHAGRAWPILKALPLAPALWLAWQHPHDLRLALVLGGLAVVYGVVAWRNAQL